MRTLSLLLKAALFSLLLVQPACAAKQDESPEKAIRAALNKQFPDHKIGTIGKTPLAGVYEVVVGNEIIYSDATGKYVLFGELVDIAAQKSLTQQSKRLVYEKAYKNLPFDAAIKVVRGKGERQMAVFTDPDCPYCKQLDRDVLKSLDNVTLYYFMYPLDQLHPAARGKSVKVWCAPDRVKAWYDLILEGKVPDNDGKCEAPLERIAQEAAALGISGTPGMIFPNGTFVPGVVQGAQIEALLNASKPGKK